MDSLTVSSVFPIFILINLHFPVYAIEIMCFDNGNYTANSTYSANLINILPSLSLNMGHSGFHNASLGQNPDQIYASALCRADAQLDACRSCVQTATGDVLNRCLNRKQAFLWENSSVLNFPDCMTRYSDKYFLGTLDNYVPSYSSSESNVTSPEQFSIDLHTLLNSLVAQAASGGSLMKVAAGNRTGPNSHIIYALLQCTPDISSTDCTRCLSWGASNPPAVNWFVMHHPNCYLRFDIFLFFNITRIEEAQRILSLSSAPVPQVPGTNDHKKKTLTAVIVVVPVISSLMCLACLGVCLRKRTKKKQDENLQSEHEISPTDTLRYDFNHVREATNNFADANKLGEGGFGAVYKGKLKNGQEIAVKRLLRGSIQGDWEFRNEVLLLAKLQHRNLVRLVGFVQEREERVLIYEFIENASLDHFIFDPIKAQCIDWNSRFKIIRGIAKGLLYLHEDSRLRVIHRDLKPSNVLLDANMTPKIADFGMARLCEHDESVANTRRIAGTFGYMAPEYVRNGQLSIKSDVFSFGVLIIEIVSGKKNRHSRLDDAEATEGLLDFAWRNWHDGTLTNLIDPALKCIPSCLHEIIRCVHIGLLCVQDNACDRPTMASVVLMLGNSTVILPLPLKSRFFVSESSDESPDSKLAQPNLLSKNECSITEVHPR